MVWCDGAHSNLNVNFYVKPLFVVKSPHIEALLHITVIALSCDPQGTLEVTVSPNVHVVRLFLGKGRDSDTDCCIGTSHCYLSLTLMSVAIVVITTYLLAASQSARRSRCWAYLGATKQRCTSFKNLCCVGSVLTAPVAVDVFETDRIGLVLRAPCLPTCFILSGMVDT